MINTDAITINNSLTDFQIESLINYSTTDPVLAKWTSDPVRFSSAEAVQKWLQANPEYLVLTDRDGELLGIAWLQKKPFPLETKIKFTSEDLKKYKNTSGIRLYGAARGKGLGVWFYTQLFDRFESQYVWAKISADNAASLRLRIKLSFKPVSESDAFNKIILVRDSHNN